MSTFPDPTVAWADRDDPRIVPITGTWPGDADQE